MRLGHTLILIILLSVLTCILCSCRNKTRSRNATKVKTACNRTKKTRPNVEKKQSRAVVRFGNRKTKKQCSLKIKKRSSRTPAEPPAKFSCPRDSPILANNSQKAENRHSVYCRKEPFPCTKNCYEAKTCSLLGRHDFMVKYECETNVDNEEYDPSQCKRLCCRSNATELRNCTWQYTTDGNIGKGKDTLLAVRNVDFYPFIMEVCAVHKKNDSDICGMFWPLEIVNAGNGVVQPVQPVQPIQPNPIQVPPGPGIEALAAQGGNMGLLGNLGNLGVSALLTLKGCNPIDIIFIVDGSHSVFKSGFDNELRFVKGVLGYFDFSAKSAKRSRAGLIVSGSSDFQFPTKTIFDLTTYASSNTANADLLTKISGIKYPDIVASDSNVAVNMAASLFQSGTKRAGVRRVTVLMTDGIGGAVKAATLATVISTLQGVTGEVIYAIETTTNLAGELTSLVNIPEDHTTYPPSFADLPVVAPLVVDQICTKITSASMDRFVGTSVVTATAATTVVPTQQTTMPPAPTTVPAAITPAPTTLGAPSTAITTASTTFTTTTTALPATTVAATTALPATTVAPTTVLAATTAITTDTTTDSTATTTTNACVGLWLPCTQSSDCCSINTATAIMNPSCSLGTCDCHLVGVRFSAIYSQSCCDTTSPPTNIDANVITCPSSSLHYPCYFSSISPSDCQPNLTCTANPAALAALGVLDTNLGFCN